MAKKKVSDQAATVDEAANPAPKRTGLARPPKTVKPKTPKKSNAKSKASKPAETKAAAAARKKKEASLANEFAILKTARRFRSLGYKRIGMLFAGGPAPGANAVISTAAINFLNHNYEVVGFYQGYQYLENFDRDAPKLFQHGIHYKNLQLDDVTKIRQLGGSVLKTARANPAKSAAGEIKSPKDLADPRLSEKLYKVLDALEYMGVSALISIGGDDTLKTAYYLNLLGVPTVHVPKTIDNDYFGIPWTFGYFTAIEHARQDIKTYNVEVRTTECYFVLELMGRKAGWYTLGAGIAGEAVRMIGPEEIEDNFDLTKLADELVDLAIKREAINKRYGVILVSEGLGDKLPVANRAFSKDEHGNIKLSEAKTGELIGKAFAKRYKERTGRKLTVKTETIGYTTRCVEPSAFDILLGSQLGMGAFEFILHHKYGSMVSVGDNLEIKRVPFEQLIDRGTFKTRVRYVPLDGDFYKLAKSLEFRPTTNDVQDKGVL
jgi:6-phosphofructokinase 1